MWAFPVTMFQQVHHEDLVACTKPAEVHNNVVTLCDCLGRELAVWKIDRVFHDVAIVSDHVKGNGCIVLVHEG